MRSITAARCARSSNVRLYWCNVTMYRFNVALNAYNVIYRLTR